MGEPLTENVPPVPPAPEHPHANWPQQGQGTYPSYGPPQPQNPPGYGQHLPQYAPYPPQQYAPAGQWPQAGPPRPKSSGYRVAAGIVEIVLGVWLILPSIAGFGLGGGAAFMGFLALVAALGNIAAGIVLLAHQRNRTQGAPVTSLSFAGLALLLGLIGLSVPYIGGALFVFALVLATPVLIVMGLGLAKEKRTA